jgi:ankyrin repeat protein
MRRQTRRLGVWMTALLAVSAATVIAAERPPLIDAARDSDHEAVRRLLRQPAVKINATEGDGTTALHWSSYRDDLESADLLIRAGANVNAVNDLGATALWTASVNGSATMVRRLLQAGADANLALLSGETPLMAASRSGSTEVAEQLLANGARTNAIATRDQTALMWAAAQHHPHVVKLLLAHGADIQMKSKVWSEVMAVAPHGRPEYNRDIPHGGDTALMFAVRSGDLESTTLLVAAGANVNDADAWGVSATALAAHAGFRDLVVFLLGKGADANAGAPGFTALHAAIMRRDEQMASALIAHGADANAPVGDWTPTRRSSKDWNFNPELVGATPLWLAARVTHPGIMRLLTTHGADPLVVHHVEYYAGDRGEKRTQTTTLLMAALGMGGGGPWLPVERREREKLTLETVKVAIELGVDVNVVNDDGRSALDAAKALDYETVIKFLEEHGVKVGSPETPSSPSQISR